jgi:hypothetical protein
MNHVGGVQASKNIYCVYLTACRDSKYVQHQFFALFSTSLVAIKSDQTVSQFSVHKNIKSATKAKTVVVSIKFDV